MTLFQTVFANTIESLQFLALIGTLLVMNFSLLIYIVEPRDNIDTYWRAVWLAVVTMTTVGYGDVAPATSAGNVVISVLILCSVLFMAIPIGVLGNAFASVWSERDLIFLIDQTHRRLQQWGYAPEDFSKFVLQFDSDGDGEINLDDFVKMLAELKVDLKGDRAIELFQHFDEDHGGTIDDKEFLRAVYPKTFHEILKKEKEEEEEKHRELERKKKLEAEEARKRIFFKKHMKGGAKDVASSGRGGSNGAEDQENGEEKGKGMLGFISGSTGFGMMRSMSTKSSGEYSRTNMFAGLRDRVMSRPRSIPKPTCRDLVAPDAMAEESCDVSQWQLEDSPQLT
jgi:hypothetical protein